MNYRASNPPIIFDLPLPAGASKLTPPSAPKNDWVTENSTEMSMDVEGSVENSPPQMENSTNAEGAGGNMEDASLQVNNKTENSSEKTDSIDENDTPGVKLSRTSEENSKDSENADRCTEEISETPENDAKSKSNDVMDKESKKDFDSENCMETENSSSNLKLDLGFFHKPDSDSDNDDDDDCGCDAEPEWEETETFEKEEFHLGDSILLPSIKPKDVKPKGKVMFSDNVVDMDDDSDEDVITKIEKQEERALIQSYEDSLQTKIVVHPCTTNATKAWEMLSVKQTVKEVEPLDLQTPVYPDKVSETVM